MDKELPLSERERRQHRIRYYQWVPFLLLFQAILCYIPRLVWRTLNVRSGLDIVNLVDAAIKYESVDKFSDREKIMAYIIRNIERYIGARRSRYERLYGRQLCTAHKSQESGGYAHSKQQLKNPSKSKQNSSLGLCCSKCWLRIKIVLSTICFWTGKRLGNYLVVLYMFVKTLWLTNAVSQLFLLNRFIGNDYHAFGVEIIEMLLSGQEWHELRHFPRVTYCDFKIREIGNSHDWTVQCVLRINLFNEVIYIFMWFWLCILAVCSLIDYATWTLRILIPSDKLRFVKRHLDIYNFYLPQSQRQSASDNQANGSKPTFLRGHNLKQNQQNDGGNSSQEQEYSNNFEYVDIEKEKRLIREFTFSYLKDDGVFAMRILASSASDLIVTEVISELWKNFRNNYVEPGEEITLVSSPSSSSSSASSNSSHQTSAASSPSSMMAPNSKSPTSPSSLVKKPFNYSSTQRNFNSNINSPIYSNANNSDKNSNNKSMPNSTTINLNSNRTNNSPQPQSQTTLSSTPQMGSSLPPLPPPLSVIPPVQSPDETNSNANTNTIRKLSSNGVNTNANVNTNYSARDSVLYPQLQQRNLHYQEHSSNANPNAKDTHV